jgi:hypothetical protein
MTGNLATTNLLLGIMAAVSVLQGLLLVGVAIAGWTLYRRVAVLIETIDAKHAAPLAAHVHAILDDVQETTTTVKEETERVARMLSNARERRQRIIGVARGLRRVVNGFLHAA